jgi:hypothetical protein
MSLEDVEDAVSVFVASFEDSWNSARANNLKVFDAAKEARRKK